MRGQERPLAKVQPQLQGDSTMEGSQGTTEAWHHEKLGEAIEDIMEKGRDLASCHRIRTPKERPVYSW